MKRKSSPASTRSCSKIAWFWTNVWNIRLSNYNICITVIAARDSGWYPYTLDHMRDKNSSKTHQQQGFFVCNIWKRRYWETMISQPKRTIVAIQCALIIAIAVKWRLQVVFSTSLLAIRVEDSKRPVKWNRCWYCFFVLSNQANHRKQTFMIDSRSDCVDWRWWY